MTELASDEFVPCPRHGTHCYPEIPDLSQRIECAIGLGDGGPDGVRATRDRIMWMIEDHVAAETGQLQHRRTTPCDGESCEQGGAAHCHRCPEAETDNLLRDRDRWREGWRRACAFLVDAGWNGDERWESLRAEVETAGTAPTALNLPAFAWGESVTWSRGRVLVPLNRDNETVADLVLDEEAAGTLAAMLDDAAGASDLTDWGEPGIQWTCGVRRPDGSTTTDTDAPPADDETAVRAYVDAMQDGNGYRKALLRRDVSAWREVDPAAVARDEAPQTLPSGSIEP